MIYGMPDFVDGSTCVGDYICNLYRGLENTIIRKNWCVDISLAASDWGRWFHPIIYITIISAYNIVCTLSDDVRLW